MKLLSDGNISARILKYLLKQFPESTHIDYLKIQGCADSDIWELSEYNYIKTFYKNKEEGLLVLRLE